MILIFIILLIYFNCFSLSPQLQTPLIRHKSLFVSKKPTPPFIEEQSRSLAIFLQQKIQLLSQQGKVLIVSIDICSSFVLKQPFPSQTILTLFKKIAHLPQVYILQVEMSGEKISELPISAFDASPNFSYLFKSRCSFMEQEDDRDFVLSLIKKIQPQNFVFFGFNTSACVYGSLESFFKQFPLQKVYIPFSLLLNMQEGELVFSKNHSLCQGFHDNDYMHRHCQSFLNNKKEVSSFYIDHIISKQIIPLDLELFDLKETSDLIRQRFAQPFHHYLGNCHELDDPTLPLYYFELKKHRKILSESCSLSSLMNQKNTKKDINNLLTPPVDLSGLLLIPSVSLHSSLLNNTLSSI